MRLMTLLSLLLIGIPAILLSQLQSRFDSRQPYQSLSTSNVECMLEVHIHTTGDIDDDDVVCCVVQKQTEQGYLKVSIVNEGSNPFASDGESKETTAAYGVVSVCNKK